MREAVRLDLRSAEAHRPKLQTNASGLSRLLSSGWMTSGSNASGPGADVITPVLHPAVAEGCLDQLGFLENGLS